MAGFGTAPQEADGAGRWRPVTRSRTYELVIDRIEEQILSGRLQVGDRLPAERDLASMLGVSRAAVREAIRALEAQGVLRMSVGTGPDSGTTVAAMPSEALNRLLRLHVALANFPMKHVVEARIMLERASAHHAATRASTADLAEMAELLAEMDDPECERERFNELDTDFHVAMAEAGGNRLIADMTTAIRDSMRRPLMKAFDDLGDSWAAIADGLRQDHHGIYEALEAGDGDLAQQRTESHIRTAYETFFGDLGHG